MESDRNEEQLRERIANVIAEHVELPNGGLNLLNAIMEEIEWDSVIVSDEEFGDIRQMAENVETMMRIVTEWGWLR